MHMENTWAFIFARGGSKGIPRKNLQELNGLPLIAHSIEKANQCSAIRRVILSTDCEEIAEVGKKHGAEVPFIRPKNLASDTSSEVDAWRHAIMETKTCFGEEVGTFVSLPPTSPFRSERDISNAIELYRSTESDLVVSVTDAARNPYFNMVSIDEMGLIKIAAPGPTGQRIVRRQDAPQVFDLTTVVYVASPSYVLGCDGLLDGRVRAINVPAIRALDIDTPLDLEFARFIAAKSDKK